MKYRKYADIKYADLSEEEKEILKELFKLQQEDIHPYKHARFSDLTEEQKDEVAREFAEEVEILMREKLTN